MNVQGRIELAIKTAGVAITGMHFPVLADKTTWTVEPLALQGAAQPVIDAFNIDDPTAELDMQITELLDQERVFAAIVWVILDTFTQTAPATIPKFNTARTRIISAYKARPWLP